MHNSSWYFQFAKAAARFCGRPRVFAIAVGVMVEVEGIVQTDGSVLARQVEIE